MFGNMGFVWFDTERKAVMGVALTVTCLSMVATAFCCVAFSTNQTMLSLTAWGIAHSKFKIVEDGNGRETTVGQITYIGLRQLVVATCTDVSNDDWVNWGDCSMKVCLPLLTTHADILELSFLLRSVFVWVVCLVVGWLLVVLVLFFQMFALTN
jgi:hypothetical protein